MTADHPITPPPKWQIDAWQARIETMGSDVPGILLDIAQWGADQELEACLEWVAVESIVAATELRATRRPKPPSLKEQAFAALVQPEPPADGEVAELVAALKNDAECVEAEQHDLCNMTAQQMHRVADLLERLAQPEPQGPTNEEILALSQEHGVSYTMRDGGVIYGRREGYDMRDDVLSFAQAVLARWGRPAIEPVPQQEVE